SVSDGNGGIATGTVGVTVTDTPIPNRPPVAADDTLVTEEDTSDTVVVVANDSDPDGDTLLVEASTTPAHGSVACSPVGGCFYIPDRDYAGADSFGYTLSDGRGGSATASVAVTVTPVNDAPAVTDDAFTTPVDAA